MSEQLDSDVEFALNLIAAEENSQQIPISSETKPQTPVQNKSDNTPQTFIEQTPDENGQIIIEQRDITIDNQFTLSGVDVNNNQITMPVQGPGLLDTFVMSANSRDFSVRVEKDNFNVIDDDFDTLQNISTELSHVGAFEKNGNFVVSVSSYMFDNILNIVIIPGVGTEITLTLARAELILGMDNLRLLSGLSPEQADLLSDISP